MGLKYSIGLLCALLVICTQKPIFAEDDDTVVIEAEPLAEKKRDSRQILLDGPALQVHSTLVLPTDVGPNTLALGTCITSKGVLGKCTSLRTCYPSTTPPPQNTLENWVVGMYETCTYYTAQGRQMYGVCCTNPPTDSGKVDDSANSTVPKYPVYPQIENWPPPIITHPPDHTIPPLPTHPPSPGYPLLPVVTQPTPIWPPQQPPYQPPTAKPPQYKPPQFVPPTTKPPYKPPTAPAPVLPPTSGVQASCGAKNGYQDQERIVGGHNADVNEWPWIAALFNGGRQFCGGSLIDNIHILSAAHCVAHMSSWDVARLTVRLGDYNIKTNHETRHIEKRVKRVVRHRGFDSRTLYNDIAILTLDSPVEFSQNIRPVCLPSGNSDFAGQTATVIGWGSLRENGPQPSILQEVNIPIWSNRDCKIKYGPAAPGGIVEHMLCAGQASRDSCSGDSGGPLMVNSGRWTQVGVVSWGIGCGKGQYPGVYTRVEKFLPWIQKNLK